MNRIIIFLLLISSININAKNMNGIMNERPKLKHSTFLMRTVVINKPVDSVFNYIVYDLKNNYTAMAEGHIKYELINSNYLKVGTEIDCREKAANQTIHHIYRVEKIIPNEHIFYHSSPSKVFIELPRKTIEASSNTYVYYDFKKNDNTTTSLQMIIAIQFDSSFQKFFSIIVGSIKPWRIHQKEELENLKTLIEN